MNVGENIPWFLRVVKQNALLNNCESGKNN